MNKTGWIVIIIIVLVIGTVLFRGGSGEQGVDREDQSSTPEEIPTIVIRGHQIPQGEIRIPVGATIVWRNEDRFVGLPYNQHTITSGKVDPTGAQGARGAVPNSGSGVSDGLFQQGLDVGETFSFTFVNPGVYTFYIAEHPSVSGEGIIVVEATQEQAVAIDSTAFSFSPNNLRARVGGKVTLAVTATGQHTFTIDELGVNVVTPHGRTTRVEFTPNQKGSFQFYCAIPGHKEAGQIGTLIVE